MLLQLGQYNLAGLYELSGYTSQAHYQLNRLPTALSRIKLPTGLSKAQKLLEQDFKQHSGWTLLACAGILLGNRLGLVVPKASWGKRRD